MNINLNDQEYNKSVLIYTTNECNWRCAYCYNYTDELKACLDSVDEYEYLKDFVNYLLKEGIVDHLLVS
jgi:MoaA/NifB/PqqE/SkfB family radical SAM enzyme